MHNFETTAEDHGPRRILPVPFGPLRTAQAKITWVAFAPLGPVKELVEGDGGLCTRTSCRSNTSPHPRGVLAESWPPTWWRNMHLRSIYQIWVCPDLSTIGRIHRVFRSAKPNFQKEYKSTAGETTWSLAFGTRRASARSQNKSIKQKQSKKKQKVQQTKQQKHVVRICRFFSFFFCFIFAFFRFIFAFVLLFFLLLFS